MTFNMGNVRTLEDIGKLAVRHKSNPEQLERLQKMARMAAGHPEVDREEAQLLWLRIRKLRERCLNSTSQGTAAKGEPEEEEQTSQGKRQTSRDAGDKA